MNNEPVALTQGDILSILQDANSVLLGQPIWNSTEEYNKLKAIIESAIRYTHPVKEFFEDEPQAEELHEILQSNAELTDEEIEECCCFLDVRLHHRYEPNAVVKDIEWTVTGIKDFVSAILRKAQENGNV